jgi:hypothetical protein
MRIALPARLRKTAALDGRAIAEAVAAALADTTPAEHRIAIEVPGAGRPVSAIAPHVAGRVASAARGPFGGGR